MKMKEEFRHAVNTLKANIFILIASAGSTGRQGTCIAAPPNSVTTPKGRHFDLDDVRYDMTVHFPEHQKLRSRKRYQNPGYSAG
ncbi:hypothetical protein MTO96_044486 [Rhipicephalus appendiculatus]